MRGRTILRIMAVFASIGVAGLILALMSVFLYQGTGAPIWDIIALISFLVCLAGAGIAAIAMVWYLVRD